MHFGVIRGLFHCLFFFFFQMACGAQKGTITVLENNARKMLMLFSNCDSYFMGLQVLQTFGFLRLSLNPGFGRQELTAHEIKTIMVAGNNWGRWQKWCSPSGWREALPFVARLEKASWISRCFSMFQWQQELRVFISPSPICLVRRFQPLVLLDCVAIVCAFLISRLDHCHVVCSALRLRTTQKLQLIAVCSCLLTYPHFRHKP